MTTAPRPTRYNLLRAEAGDLLVLPANTRCRAYRWPRDSRTAAVFLAVYPHAAGERPAPEQA
jgi:hypothetical protein